MSRCTTNRELLLPYTLPYFAWGGVPLILENSFDPTVVYAVRMVLVTGILLYFRNCYLSMVSPDPRWGVAVSVRRGVFWGLSGCVLWVMLVSPFVAKTSTPWPGTAFFLRMLCAALLVPVFEELLMRGYLFRLTGQWMDALRNGRGKRDALVFVLDEAPTIHETSAATGRMPAVLLSTVVFAVGHPLHEWPAAFVYGLMMCVLLIRSGGLTACITAHGTTNLALAVYIWFTNQWHFW